MSEPLVIKGADGKEYEFPPGTKKEIVAKKFTDLGVKPVSRISGEYGDGFSKPKAAKI